MTVERFLVVDVSQMVLFNLMGSGEIVFCRQLDVNIIVYSHLKIYITTQPHRENGMTENRSIQNCAQTLLYYTPSTEPVLVKSVMRTMCGKV